MTIITKETFTNEIEIQVMDTKKSKRILKQALIKAFGKEQGEYLNDYAVIFDGSYTSSIVLNKSNANDLLQVL